MEHNLTEGSVFKKLLYFTIPIFGANLLHAMYGTVDLMVVGLFSDAASVSAVSTGSMTMQTLSSIVIGLTMGSTVLLGQNIGRKDEKAAARTIGSSLWLFIGLGLILTVAMMFLAAPVAGVMNAPDEAFAQTASYIRICGGGVIFIVLFNAIGGMFRGIGNSRTPLILMGIACVSNIIGDVILVGLFGMKSDGAAIATIAAQGISVVSAFLMVWKNGFGFEVDSKSLKPARKETVKILQYGAPIAAQDALTGVSFMVILAIMNSFGLIASAGVGVAEKICGLMFIVPGAIMASVSAFSAQNVGAGEYGRAKRGMYYGMEIAAAVGLVMFAISYFNGVWLSHFFAKDPLVCAASADYLRSYSIDCVLVAFVFSMMGYLNGHGQTLFVAIQGILCTFLVRIPVAWFMSKIPGVSLFQVGFATPLASLFGIIITGIYLWKFEKRRQG